MRSPFWNSFFDHFSACGRNAALFVIILFLVAAAGLGGPVFFNALDRHPMLVWAAAGILGLAGALTLKWLASLRAMTSCPEHLGRLPPLENADLRAARARLKRSRNTR